MQQGQTTYTYHTEVRDHAFLVSNVTANIINPANTSSSLSNVAVTPGIESKTQVYEGIAVVGTPGLYRIDWVTTGGGETRTVTNFRFVFWYDVATMVRSRLQKTPDTLGDEMIESVYNTLWQTIKLKYNAPSYDAIIYADRLNLEQGLAILTALSLRHTTSRSTAVGEITGFRIQQVQYSFGSSVTGAGDLSVDDQWMNDAYTSLNLVSWIAGFYTAANPRPSMWRKAGPTSTRTAYCRETLFSYVASLVSDTFNGVFTTEYLLLG